jgi:hypothetical protein
VTNLADAIRLRPSFCLKARRQFADIMQEDKSGKAFYLIGR